MVPCFVPRLEEVSDTVHANSLPVSNSDDHAACSTNQSQPCGSTISGHCPFLAICSPAARMKQLKHLLKVKQGKPSKSSQHPISPGKPVNTTGPSSHRELDTDLGAEQSCPREVDHAGFVAAPDQEDRPDSQVSSEDTMAAGREPPPSETGTTSVTVGGGREHGTHPSSECFRSFRLGLVLIMAFASRPISAEDNGDTEGRGVGLAEEPGGAC
jgi:hypothetical protein